MGTCMRACVSVRAGLGWAARKTNAFEMVKFPEGHHPHCAVLVPHRGKQVACEASSLTSRPFLFHSLSVCQFRAPALCCLCSRLYAQHAGRLSHALQPPAAINQYLRLPAAPHSGWKQAVSWPKNSRSGAEEQQQPCS